MPDKSEQTSSVKRKKVTGGRRGSRERRARSFVVPAFIVAPAPAARLSANHFPKPAMEEAASLFGPPDSASDPFGSIVTNGSDDHAASSTSPPNEHPLSETQKVDPGSGWFDGSSGHYQAEASLYPEYEWRSSDDAGSHYNSPPHYEGSTPSGYYHQSLNAHGGANLQYTESHDGE